VFNGVEDLFVPFAITMVMRNGRSVGRACGEKDVGLARLKRWPDGSMEALDGYVLEGKRRGVGGWFVVPFSAALTLGSRSDWGG